MRPIALAIFFTTIFMSAAAHGAPENLADFADAWGKGNVTHWPPPAPPTAPATPPAPPATPPAEVTKVPPALQPGGDPTMANQEPPTATQPSTAQDMQQTGQLPEGRLRDTDDDTDVPQEAPSPTAPGAAVAAPPAGEHTSPPVAPSPGVGSVNPHAKELWQFSAPKSK